MPTLGRNHSSIKYNQNKESDENLKNIGIGWVREKYGGVV